MTKPRVSIVMPAYQESETIIPTLERLSESITLSHEVIVVVDSHEDSTIAVMAAAADRFPSVRVVVQNLGPGPANAIKFGFDLASAQCTVVTMCDGSDDPRVIDTLALLVERGCVIAAASRYMPGGAQIGGPRLKGILSRTAGLTLFYMAGVGTRDATNSFKAYSTEFVRSVGIDSQHGFEIGIELVAKARRLRLPIAEVPTIWLDRDAGISNFQLRKWIPEYLAWYRFAYGRRLQEEHVRALTRRGFGGWRP